MPDNVMAHDTIIFTMDEKIMEFFLLTRKALDSDSDEIFISVLVERNALIGSLEQFSSSLRPEYVVKMTFIESKILERLKGETKKIIEDIDRLSRKINTARFYSARFPIPSMPAFFDQTR